MNSAAPKLSEAQALKALVAQHGARVRRAVAMELLQVADSRTFKKVVDANPQMRHRLPGEGQWKYLTSEIFALLPAAARCATRGQAGDACTH